MDALWDAAAPLSVRDVMAVLERATPRRELAYTTVMTVLDRLAGKQMAVREREGRAFRYQPARSREEATAELLHAALDDAGTDRTSALVHFVRTVDADEARALRAALDDVLGGGEAGRP